MRCCNCLSGIRSILILDRDFRGITSSPMQSVAGPEEYGETLYSYGETSLQRGLANCYSRVSELLVFLSY